MNNKKTLTFLIILTCFIRLVFAENYISIGGRIRNQVTEEICKKHNLEVTGIGGAFVDELNSFTVGFKSSECLSRELARKLFIEISELYAERVNKHRSLRPYLHTYPFCPCENSGVLLSFPKNSEITLMMSCRGRILYEKKNLYTDRYETLFEEPYEEARAIVLEGKSKALKD